MKFAVASVVVGEGDATLDSFKGLGKSNPVLALAMTILLLAQAGVPVTSGFIAKFGVIRAAVSVESYLLAVIAMIAAIVAAFLYLKVLATIWLKQSESLNIEPLSWSQKLVIGGSVTMTFVLGLYPQILLKQLVNF